MEIGGKMNKAEQVIDLLEAKSKDFEASKGNKRYYVNATWKVTGADTDYISYGSFDDFNQAKAHAFKVFNSVDVQGGLKDKFNTIDLLIEDTQLKGVKYYYWLIKSNVTDKALLSKVNGWVILKNGKVIDKRTN